MNCASCGRSLEEGSAYCSACGQKVVATLRSQEFKPSRRLVLGFIAISLIVSCIVANSGDSGKGEDSPTSTAPSAITRIDSLDARARSIPAGNFKENLEAYEELLTLAPENDRYRERVAHYRARLDASGAMPRPVAKVAPPHRIMSDERLGTIKRMVEVRLEGVITVEELKTIARQIRQERDQRTFILYYLPGMESGHGAWASTHFNPDLDVVILGETVDEAAKRASSNVPEEAREVAGAWVISGLVARRIDIYSTEDGWWIRVLHKGGSGSPVRATRTAAGGLVAYVAEGATDGEHYRIRSDGSLEIWDQEGLIESARPLAR